jgi:hypothetical protein
MTKFVICNLDHILVYTAGRGGCEKCIHNSADDVNLLGGTR